MAIGHIKSTKIVDGQITAVLETGTGLSVTAIIMQESGAEFHPLPGDTVVFDWAGQEVNVSAVLAGDASTDKGESLVFSRNRAGSVMASVHLKSDGKIDIQTTGVSIGKGTSPVSLSKKVDLLFNALKAACAGFSPPGSPDGGAALSKAIAGALSAIDTGSSNLGAD